MPIGDAVNMTVSWQGLLSAVRRVGVGSMRMVLLGAGICLLLAGFGALGYGIQYKEFGLGNTFIIAGAVAACSGFLMTGLWAVVRELQDISRRLGSGSVASAFPAEPALAPVPDFLPPRPVVEEVAVGTGPEALRAESRETSPLIETAPAAKPKRNLLFTSTSRRERERAAARASELPTDVLPADLRPNPPAVDGPPLEPVPMPPNFEDAWPKSERARRTGRHVAPPEGVPAAPARDDKPQVTVLKSGVVDGMAYSLYSDGSIEAQMPEGMMRFASIDELRAHLDQRP